MTPQRFERGARAIRQATSLAADAAPREREFIAIMAQRYRGSFADWQTHEGA